MGLEGPPKPPQFIIDAAMKEDPTPLKRMASAGGKATARKNAERKRLAELAEKQKQEQLADERATFEAEEQRILRRDAFAHAEAIDPREDD